MFIDLAAACKEFWQSRYVWSCTWEGENFIGFRSMSYGWRWRQQHPLKRWYPTAKLHGITTQKASIWMFTTMKTSNLAIL